MAITTRDGLDEKTVPGLLRLVRNPVDTAWTATSALALVLLFGLVLSRAPHVVRAELDVDVWFSAHHVAVLTAVARAIDVAFSPAPAILLTVVVVGVIVRVTRNWRVGATFAVLVAGSYLSSYAVKILVHRPRPDAHALAHPYLPTPLDYSYPSGHTAFAASLALALILLARGHRRQRLVIVIGAAASLVVAWSRVYLGAHYPSDVAASLLWALGAETLLLVFWNRLVLPRTSRTPSTVEPHL